MSTIFVGNIMLHKPSAAIKHIVVLTGAGISAESGIPTFRAADGLWENEPVELVATPQGFAHDPARVHRFYNARRAHLQRPEVQPNVAHLALARLQREFHGIVTLVTQNVDNLHERAGSQQVLHMHGELNSIRCVHSGQRFFHTGDLDTDSCCACCQRSATLRPDIVWFGEMPMHMDDIYNALAQADLFVSIGTSGHVYPAAGFVEEARAAGVRTLELNLEPSKNHHAFDDGAYGPASRVVPDWVTAVLQAG
ncbi:NAD-dependent protein deacylase [Pokkaliibacter plantistimulans]|uniref:NAD-dependent protein deacylase n=1 Tax=Proteobacteria bacterium 228 TaxID=2083153 RepID=A0A2S5KJP3_9PROT|nr:Sir2 family NAD+-dependent deacetylase [Pokkaliibacter plantistimulans]PPC74833.1 NAD-dependent protein deacylase [Pokkaliibacter plantistimulans]